MIDRGAMPVAIAPYYIASDSRLGLDWWKLAETSVGGTVGGAVLREASKIFGAIFPKTLPRSTVTSNSGLARNTSVAKTTGKTNLLAPVRQ
ncbi:MAG TPA: hypothetical protein VLC08_13375 [Chitinolyticbacter sp.]|nr:hypothetical protein [Chitinolyticbacter sp.]